MFDPVDATPPIATVRSAWHSESSRRPRVSERPQGAVDRFRIGKHRSHIRVEHHGTFGKREMLRLDGAIGLEDPDQVPLPIGTMVLGPVGTTKVGKPGTRTSRPSAAALHRGIPIHHIGRGPAEAVRPAAQP